MNLKEIHDNFGDKISVKREPGEPCVMHTEEQCGDTACVELSFGAVKKLIDALFVAYRQMKKEAGK